MWFHLRNYSGIFLERLNQITRDLSLDIWSLGRDFKPEPPEYLPLPRVWAYWEMKGQTLFPIIHRFCNFNNRLCCLGLGDLRYNIVLLTRRLTCRRVLKS